MISRVVGQLDGFCEKKTNDQRAGFWRDPYSRRWREVRTSLLIVGIGMVACFA
jgi:hypothetical protein